MAPVDDLVIHPRDNDLVVGTHGRSVWIMADVFEHEHTALFVPPGDSDALAAAIARLASGSPMPVQCECHGEISCAD